jgi:hypothetical protein
MLIDLDIFTVLEKTGVRKSTLLINMAISDIQTDNGLCIIDRHGDIAESILKYIPQERIDDVIYFNPGDADFPIAFNPCNTSKPSPSGRIRAYSDV